jgi:hypothetical protein
MLLFEKYDFYATDFNTGKHGGKQVFKHDAFQMQRAFH